MKREEAVVGLTAEFTDVGGEKQKIVLVGINPQSGLWIAACSDWTMKISELDDEDWAGMTEMSRPAPRIVHVVMSNDYPDCVFGDSAAADAYVERRMRDPKNRHPNSTTPRVYYRQYEFEVGKEGRIMWS